MGTSRAELTARQAEVWLFIDDHRRTHGYAPSMREVAEHFGWVSTKAVSDHYAAIAKKGWARITPRVNRSIVTIGDASSVRDFTHEIIAKKFSPAE